MSETGMEWARGRIAQLEADYTGACEAIRQLEANVAEARAEVERTNHIMRLERMARQDSEDRLKAQLTAAEAAREAVLASLAAAEAVAGEVREACVRSLNGMQRLYLGSNHVFVAKVLSDAKNAIRSVPLPTPSAALQRVREQAQREGAERALMEAWMNGPPITFDSRAMLGSRDRWVAACMARLFPTPDAGGK